jgi:hypothetical protein
LQKQGYHYRVPSDQFASQSRDEDAIRINSFLRDFVIDFGPLETEDVNSASHPNRTEGTIEDEKDIELGSHV